jgi:hypothetical protein
MERRNGAAVSSSIKMDERAFNRGVDEVLRLKPIVRVVRSVVSGQLMPKVVASAGKALVQGKPTRGQRDK